MGCPHLPIDIYGMIAYQVASGNIEASLRLQCDVRYYRTLGGEWRRTLGAMRLASKLLCQAATPYLFRHLVATERIILLEERDKVAAEMDRKEVMQPLQQWPSQVNASISTKEPQQLHSLPLPLVRLSAIAASPRLAIHVRQVDIGLAECDFWSLEFARAFAGAGRDLDEDSVSDELSARSDHSSGRPYISGLRKVLASSLAQFPNIGALYVKPLPLRPIPNDMAAHPGESLIYDPDYVTDPFEHTRYERLRQAHNSYCVAKTYEIIAYYTFCAIRDVALPKLTELELVLPNPLKLPAWLQMWFDTTDNHSGRDGTFNIGDEATKDGIKVEKSYGTLKEPISRLLRGLRHLSLELHGVCPSCRHHNPPQPTEYSKANAKICDRNDAYVAGILRPVCNSLNLESLTIASFRGIDLDIVDLAHGPGIGPDSGSGLSPPPLPRLRYIRLSGASASFTTIFALVVAPPRLESIELCGMELKNGTWADIMTLLAQAGSSVPESSDRSPFPGLLYFGIISCGYTDVDFEQLGSDHKEPIMYGRRFPEGEITDVASDDPRDRRALGELQRRVNANRAAAGLPPVPRHIFRRAYSDEDEERKDEHDARDLVGGET